MTQHFEWNETVFCWVTTQPTRLEAREAAMSPDSFIKLAIEAGARDGVASLDAVQRLVFLVSGAETLCDIEGIDSFLDRYGSEWLAECAIAFEMIGASEIAVDLRKIGPDTATDDPILERLNSMITGRVGYDYETICRAVGSRLIIELS